MTPVYTFPCILLPRNACEHTDKLVLENASESLEIAAELSNMQ